MCMVKKKTKNIVNAKKDNTLLVIGVVVLVGLLLFNSTGVPTGEMSRVVIEKELHTPLKADMVTTYKGYEIELIGITSNGDAIISIDNSEPRIAWWSGCDARDVGTFIGSGRYNEMGIPYGVTVKVCSSSYDMQEADLDFSL